MSTFDHLVQQLRSHGLDIQASKCLANFDTCIPRSSSPVLSWCGLALHTDTLDVHVDAKRYKDYVHAITIQHNHHPGYAFQRRMLGMVHVLFNRVYFEQMSTATIWTNIRRAGKLLAHRCRIYLKYSRWHFVHNRFLLKTFQMCLVKVLAILCACTSLSRHALAQ
jgi:hypothetical protein